MVNIAGRPSPYGWDSLKFPRLAYGLRATPTRAFAGLALPQHFRRAWRVGSLRGAALDLACHSLLPACISL